MGINFPSRPPTGQKFPDPALPNLPVWQWNGTAWVQISGGGGGGSGAASGITFAPGGNISATDVQAAILELDTEKAPLASPTFTGDPKAPTPTAGDNDTSIATTAFVTSAVAGVAVVPPATVAPIMDSVAAVGTATKYAREDHVHPSDTSRAALTQAVRYDAAQTLTGETPPYGTTMTQRAQARSNIYAAPLDALSYSGMQINGSIEVSQELGTAGSGVTNTGLYIVDGWQVFSNGAQTLSATPPVSTLSGYNRVLQVAVPTANAAPAAGNYAFIGQRVEGYRVARLGWGTANAQPITLGFWVSAVRPGTYSGSIQNSAFDRAYAFNFTVNAASTYEYKTVTIPGDTSGTWLKDNNIGMRLFFTMMAGTTFQTAAGAWTAGNFYGATGTINGVAATTDIFIIAGVVVLPGVEAPSAARSPLIMRPFDQELALCQRYFEWVQIVSPGYCPTTAIARTGLQFKAMKRANPTIAAKVIGSVTVNNPGGNAVATSFTVNAASIDSMYVDVNTSGLTLNAACSINFTANNAYLDARL